MKRIFSFVAISSLFLASCQDAPKADKATTTDAQQVQTPAAGNVYKADLAQSHVEFIGTKPVGKHHGSFLLKNGQLTVDNGTVNGGKFTIDINTLKADDQDSIGNAKLAGHLLSPDFFDAQKFPEAIFEITGVKTGVDTAVGKDVVMKDATHTITGNLTLKGVTKSISFPAKLAMNETQTTADASFNIDRTQWNLAYGNDKGLGDHFIYPEVNIQLHLVTSK
ncbi:YceI family protein [Chitinophagaceae bacterium MMS25-I14]